jgi:hypothetical protein
VEAKKGGKSKVKKQTKIDLTAMVDLLLTDNILLTYDVKTLNQ